MLDWSTARVRVIDDVLRPTRAANAERLYDVDRVLFFVWTMDMAPPVPEPMVMTLAEYKEWRAQWRAERAERAARRGARRPGSRTLRRS